MGPQHCLQSTACALVSGSQRIQVPIDARHDLSASGSRIERADPVRVEQGIRSRRRVSSGDRASRGERGSHDRAADSSALVRAVRPHIQASGCGAAGAWQQSQCCVSGPDVRSHVGKRPPAALSELSRADGPARPGLRRVAGERGGRIRRRSHTVPLEQHGSLEHPGARADAGGVHAARPPCHQQGQQRARPQQTRYKSGAMQWRRRRAAGCAESVGCCFSSHL